MEELASGRPTAFEPSEIQVSSFLQVLSSPLLTIHIGYQEFQSLEIRLRARQAVLAFPATRFHYANGFEGTSASCLPVGC